MAVAGIDIVTTRVRMSVTIAPEPAPSKCPRHYFAVAGRFPKDAAAAFPTYVLLQMDVVPPASMPQAP